jgi:hypothetical protein
LEEEVPGRVFRVDRPISALSISAFSFLSTLRPTKMLLSKRTQNFPLISYQALKPGIGERVRKCEMFGILDASLAFFNTNEGNHKK